MNLTSKSSVWAPRRQDFLLNENLRFAKTARNETAKILKNDVKQGFVTWDEEVDHRHAVGVRVITTGIYNPSTQEKGKRGEKRKGEADRGRS